jgi:bacillithiol system protein YtxJ
VIPVRDAAELEAALGAPRAVLFKHSTRCGTSARALRQLESYEATAGAAPVYLLDVVAAPALARSAAERLGIRHESPQAIVLSAGRPTWHASHGRVTADALVGATSAPEAGARR